MVSYHVVAVSVACKCRQNEDEQCEDTYKLLPIHFLVNLLSVLVMSRRGGNYTQILDDFRNILYVPALANDEKKKNRPLNQDLFSAC